MKIGDRVRVIGWNGTIISLVDSDGPCAWVRFDGPNQTPEIFGLSELVLISGQEESVNKNVTEALGAVEFKLGQLIEAVKEWEQAEQAIVNGSFPQEETNIANRGVGSARMMLTVLESMKAK